MVKLKLYLSLNLIFIILACILGYIRYGLIGLGAMLLLDVILGIISLLGFIPILGVIVYAWLGYSHVTQWVLGIAGIEYSWVVTLLLVLNGVISFGCTFHAIIRIFTPYWRWGS